MEGYRIVGTFLNSQEKMAWLLSILERERETRGVLYDVKDRRVLFLQQS